MRFRDRLLPCVGLMLLLPTYGHAQGRSPLFERALPDEVTASVSSASVEATQAAGSRPRRRDSLLNGTIIGAAVGAALGIAFVHATLDSELGATEYAYGALIFGGLGAGAGLGVDALLNRRSGVVVDSPRRIALNTRVSRKTAAVRVTMRW